VAVSTALVSDDVSIPGLHSRNGNEDRKTACPRESEEGGLLVLMRVPELYSETLFQKKNVPLKTSAGASSNSVGKTNNHLCPSENIREIIICL
jgi:hypothetical protein